MADVLRDQLPRAKGVVPDVVLIAAGANDVVHLTGRGEVMDALRTLIRALAQKNCRVKVVITGSAEMGSTSRFLWPLNALAHARTAWLNEGFRALAAEESVTFAPIADEVGPRFAADPTLFAEDRYHPNGRGYALWSQTLARALDQPQPSHCK
jgi:lysophospholipase L1-like esterase